MRPAAATRRIRRASGAVAALALLTLGSGCVPPAGGPPRPGVSFDSVAVWIRRGGDSTRLVVEVASSRTQHEVGLAGRTTLAPDAGMLFLFDPPRTADEGFWMWRTSVPLDLAFIDAEGVIRRVVGMEPCAAAAPEDCPGYFADAPYAAALEVRRGWLAAHGVAAGSTIRWEMLP